LEIICIFVIDILESIEKIEKYILRLSYEEFIKDSKTKDAVVRNLEIIGEAAKVISKDVQKRYEDIQWAQIVGMRNRLIHGYFVVDYKIVWHIVTNELPDLKRKMEKILKESTNYQKNRD